MIMEILKESSHHFMLKVISAKLNLVGVGKVLSHVLFRVASFGNFCEVVCMQFLEGLRKGLVNVLKKLVGDVVRRFGLDSIVKPVLPKPALLDPFVIDHLLQKGWRKFVRLGVQRHNYYNPKFIFFPFMIARKSSPSLIARCPCPLK